MSFFISDAMAQAAPSAQAGLMDFIPLILIFVVFYFLLIRPQQKKAKEHRNLVAALQKGDEVVTAGGILGKIRDVGETFIALEVADNTELRIQKHQVVQLMPKGTVKEARGN